MKTIYVAAPYSHHDDTVRLNRHYAATCYAAKMIQAGYNVFSPLTHSVPIAEITGENYTWVEMDLVFMSVCDELHVIMLDGWKESKGVAAEIEEAKRLFVPIIYVEEK